MATVSDSATTEDAMGLLIQMFVQFCGVILVLGMMAGVYRSF